MSSLKEVMMVSPNHPRQGRGGPRRIGYGDSKVAKKDSRGSERNPVSMGMQDEGWTAKDELPWPAKERLQVFRRFTILEVTVSLLDFQNLEPCKCMTELTYRKWLQTVGPGVGRVNGTRPYGVE